MWAKFFTTVKYCLVTVNVLCLITGVIVLAVGSSVQAAFNNYHEFLSERFFSLPAFCIATGVIILLVSFFGCYGAFMENYYMNMAFVVAMIIVFIFQLSACIAGFVLKGNTIAIVQKALHDTMQLYGPDKNIEVSKAWDTVQTGFSCCGVNGATDWASALNRTDAVPVSCCVPQTGAITTFVCDSTLAYVTGCAEAFGTWVQAHAASIGATGIFLVLLQALAVGGAFWMAKMSRAEQIYP